ncbi:MAG TPA: ATP-binding cassette domain-containing protein [Vicinamibacterales bacterium]
MALLEVRNLTKEYQRGSLFRRGAPVRALDGVSFSIEAGERFGLVGESGSGKTTTARCVLRLIEPTAGEVWFKGENVLAAPRPRLRELRREMQIVFQDPWTSLNPRLRIGDIVEEPLAIHGIGTRASRRNRVAELLTLVGLDPGWRNRYPHEFSGGQRQRVGLARAVALKPSFLIADEPVSALDVSVQAQVLNLLIDLQEQLGLTCLFIAHDLRLVRQVCSRVAVMYRGRIVELARTEDLFTAPRHPYTQALLAAVPHADPDVHPTPVPFNPEGVSLEATMAEVAPGHWVRPAEPGAKPGEARPDPT